MKEIKRIDLMAIGIVRFLIFAGILVFLLGSCYSSRYKPYQPRKRPKPCDCPKHDKRRSEIEIKTYQWVQLREPAGTVVA